MAQRPAAGRPRGAPSTASETLEEAATHRDPRRGNSVAFLLSQLGSAGSHAFSMLLAPLDIGPRHFAMLNFVADGEGQSQQALGSALGIPASRMVGLVDELEGRGLLERRPNPADRRSHALYLTAEGQRLLDRAYALAIAHEDHVCEALTAAERQELLRLLTKIGDSLGMTAGVHPELAAPGDCD